MDRSEGWDDVARQFMAARSGIGAGLVLSWARDHLPQAGSVIDVGCGSGVPIAETLIEAGFDVFGIDPSSILIAAFKHRFPDAPIACEAAQDSTFFDRKFDAALAIGLVFLLAEEVQRNVICRVAHALKAGGRFLFSAPREICEWQDMLTGRRSHSLGAQEYERLLQSFGLRLMACRLDEGGNHYYDAVKAAL